jgi:hypothetical protein
MRPWLLLAFCAFILVSCKKTGTIDHRIRFTDQYVDVSGKTDADSLYTQFGPHIATITPYRLYGNLNILAYLDNLDQQDPSTHSISYIDGHDNNPNIPIQLDVDFSGNQEVEVTPILYSTDKIGDIFDIDQVTFKYFEFVPYYINLTFELPIQYKDVQFEWQDMNTFRSYDAETDKVIYACPQNTLMLPLYGDGQRIPAGYVFGGTDSTYIFNPDAQVLPNDQCIFGGELCFRPLIRSNRFTPITVVMPDNGKSIEMYSTISFSSTGLVQLYAGADGVAYTGDDVFVYAPRFWERATVKLQVN